MSNILAFPAVDVSEPENVMRRLLQSFATERRPLDDVFWLKENAELLGILATTNLKFEPAALDVFNGFYSQIEERLRFFPQYYRFLLSICLDLEDLGMKGEKGVSLCSAIARSGAIEAELSDLQRAEARRLMSRRNAAELPSKGALGRRLRAFISRSETFAMPNKKAAYELTHIVFYLSEYGRVDPELDAAALTSLEFAGVLAFLDQNADLLAEICTALRFAGRTPSPIWEDAIGAAHRNIVPTSDPKNVDAYHAFLVTGWAQAIAGRATFRSALPDGSVFFDAPVGLQSTLRPLSACLFDLGHDRCADWGKMRGHVLPYLGEEGHQVLCQAEESTDMFGAFFEGFARAARF